ncbi:hypothetical protein ACWEOR_15275 [Micromonospora chalcea]
MLVWFRPARCSHLAEVVWINEGRGHEGRRPHDRHRYAVLVWFWPG